MIRWRATGRPCALMICLVLLAGGQVAAQSVTTGGTSSGGGATPAARTTEAESKLMDPGNGGVAGTGLGKMPPGDKTGTGMSVQGPAGQGLESGTSNAKP